MNRIKLFWINFSSKNFIKELFIESQREIILQAGLPIKISEEAKLFSYILLKSNLVMLKSDIFSIIREQIFI